VLLLWGAARKKWRFVIAAGVCITIGELLAIALYGFHNNFDYVKVLSYLSAHGETFYANSSVNGILNRWIDPGNAKVFDANGFPPEHPLVRYPTLIAAVVAVGALLFARFAKDKRADPIDLAFAGLMSTLASPIAWEHHYGLIAVCFAVALPAIMVSGSRAKWIAFAICFALCASRFAVVDWVKSAPWNIAQAYLFFAAIGVAALLVKLPPWPQAKAP
jgi:cell division protein FtsW (lipid II flippase)